MHFYNIGKYFFYSDLKTKWNLKVYKGKQDSVLLPFNIYFACLRKIRENAAAFLGKLHQEKLFQLD